MARDRWAALVVGLSLSLGLAAACAREEERAPLLQRGPMGLDGDPVSCAALVSADLGTKPIGPLFIDGGDAYCIAQGLQCPLGNVDAGVCDAGADAKLVAKCMGSLWVGQCLKPDAGDAAPEASASP